MRILVILIYMLIAAFCVVFVVAGGMFVVATLGLIYDDITGTHDCLMWSFS